MRRLLFRGRCQENRYQSAGVICGESLMSTRLSLLRKVVRIFTGAFSNNPNLRTQRGSLYGNWLTDTVSYYH